MTGLSSVLGDEVVGVGCASFSGGILESNLIFFAKLVQSLNSRSLAKLRSDGKELPKERELNLLLGCSNGQKKGGGGSLM